MLLISHRIVNSSKFISKVTYNRDVSEIKSAKSHKPKSESISGEHGHPKDNTISTQRQTHTRVIEAG